jgi:hypothetical protein
MRIVKAMRWSFLASVAVVFALAPVNVSASNSSRLAQVDCSDCQAHETICCADCSSNSQHFKCTVGMPWC